MAEDGTAGYKGRDGVTHGWWWKEWDEWKIAMERKKRKEAKEVLECATKYICVDSKLGQTRYQA